MSLIENFLDFLGVEFKKKNKPESIYLTEIKSNFEKEKEKTYPEKDPPKLFEEIHSIWDYIKFRENSQAYFISQVVGFEEWISMEEILRRVEEVFGIKFKNQRSLYPYVKTLVDLNLMEAVAVGEKMKWRKKEVLIKIKKKENTAEEKERETKKIPRKEQQT